MKQVISVERQNVGTAEVPEIELTSSGRVTIVPIDRIQPNPYLCTRYYTYSERIYSGKERAAVTPPCVPVGSWSPEWSVVRGNAWNVGVAEENGDLEGNAIRNERSLIIIVRLLWGVECLGSD